MVPSRPPHGGRGRCSEWTTLPDFASVNFDEPGTTALAELLMEKGVGVEAGLFEADGTTARDNAEIVAEAGRRIAAVRGGG